MRIPDNKGDHGGAVFCFCVSILLLLISIALIQQRMKTDPGVGIVLIVIGIGSFLMMLNMGLFMTRDYWIDSTGVYVRVLGGRVVRRKLLTDEIRYFGAVLVVSGRFQKFQIVFSQYIPKPNADGYSIHLRKTIAIDYSPELYEQICQHFIPNENAVVGSLRKRN